MRDSFFMVEYCLGGIIGVVDVLRQWCRFCHLAEVKFFAGNSMIRHVNQHAHQYHDHDEGNLRLAYELAVGVWSKRVTHEIQTIQRSMGEVRLSGIGLGSLYRGSEFGETENRMAIVVKISQKFGSKMIAFGARSLLSSNVRNHWQTVSFPVCLAGCQQGSSKIGIFGIIKVNRAGDGGDWE